MRIQRLACVGAVALLLVACNNILGFGDLTKEPTHPSSEEEPAPGTKRDAGPQTGGDDDDAGGPPITQDAGVDAAEPVSTNCPGTPPAADSYPPWVTPASRPKPCTNADLSSFLASESRSFDEQKATMTARNAACANCVFTQQNDPVWGPVIHLNDGRIFRGFAICYRLAGASEACASAAHKLEWCSQKVCNVCTSGLTLGDCQARARSNECADVANATISACQNFGTIVNTTCGGSGNVVGVICGGI